ncbi:MAG: hypothetical protein NZ772_12475 [Cyanobacteria bacterium]|nr:hypothetical protein [Cyanobacteriota bacterium]MDW8200627.1 hypothetical protein [Cyanobacteriota bacterium SKYGB_h_bin112]
MVKILESRHQYRSCHIRLPGEDQRFAAVMVDGKFYSLLKIVRDRQKALKICELLMAKGGDVVMTKTAKGDAIWLWEADAIADLPPQAQPKTKPAAVPSPPYRVLTSPEQYQTCYIRIPDIGDRLEAIYVGGKYYSLFKADQSAEQTVELAVKLCQRGDDVVVTKMAQGYTLWVLEADAVLA